MRSLGRYAILSVLVVVLGATIYGCKNRKADAVSDATAQKTQTTPKSSAAHAPADPYGTARAWAASASENQELDTEVRAVLQKHETWSVERVYRSEAGYRALLTGPKPDEPGAAILLTLTRRGANWKVERAEVTTHDHLWPTP